jgi:hypothetical protein
MDRVFLSSAMPFMAQQPDYPLETKKAKKKESLKSQKISDFEATLRKETIASIEQLTNQQSGNSQFPTRDQGMMIREYAEQPVNYNGYANKLGDYSRLLSEIQSVHSGAVDAMSLSTLTSKRPVTRIEDNNAYAMVTSQMGLNSMADRIAKKARKNPRMSAATFL